MQYCVTHCTSTSDSRRCCKVPNVETFRDQCVADLQKLLTRCLPGGFEEKVHICDEATGRSTTFDGVALSGADSS